MNYYQVTGVPYMKVDGKFPGNPATLETMYGNRYNTPTPVSLVITGSYDSITRDGTITVTLDTEEPLSAEVDWRLHIALTETEIYYNTAYNDWHYNIMRDMFPSGAGTPVVLNVGSPVEVSYDFTLPTGVPPNGGIVEENARMVAWLQPLQTGGPLYREIYQAGWEWVLDLDATGVEEQPARFALQKNFPNPFNPRTTIPVQVEKSGSVLLQVLTVDGRQVKTLHDGELGAGAHEFQWDGTDANGSPMASGIYLAQLLGQTERHTERMVLLK